MLKLTGSIEAIASRILYIRGHKVMIDADLAALYGVETKVLVQAVKRKSERFPTDFMFQLTNQEVKNLRSQIVTSSSGHGGRRTPPYAFTEQGVAMLSSVLNSPQAIASKSYAPSCDCVKCWLPTKSWLQNWKSSNASCKHTIRPLPAS